MLAQKNGMTLNLKGSWKIGGILFNGGNTIQVYDVYYPYMLYM
jgi:hypothetical protein